MRHPNKTNLLIKAPVSTVGAITTNLSQLSLKAEEVPEEFSKWITDNKITKPKQQGACGSCWAISSSSVLADRFMIAKNIQNLELNPLFPVSCSKNGSNSGCDGGIPSDCGEFFEISGIPRNLNDEKDVNNECISWEQHCKESKSDSCTNPPDCSSYKLGKCNTNYKALKNSTRSLAVLNGQEPSAELTILNIKTEIMKNGPVVGSYFISYDFYSAETDVLGWQSTNGVYINGNYNNEMNDKPPKIDIKPPQNSTWGDLIMEPDSFGSLQPAGHAVAIVGWGSEYIERYKRNIPYWIVRNSWGEKWNKTGFFKYAMYNKELNINTKIALDVPVYVKIKTDTGMGVDYLFGSATTFLPDVNTGDPKDTNFGVKNEPKDKYDDGREKIAEEQTKKNLKELEIFGYIILAIMCAWASYYILPALYKEFKELFKKQPKTPNTNIEAIAPLAVQPPI